MSFAQFCDRSGLIGIEMTLEYYENDFYHAGVYSVPKCTSAGADKEMNCIILRNFALILIKVAKLLYHDDHFRFWSQRIDDQTIF